MKQKTNRELVPKLRFPEFRDAAGWVEEKLDDIFHLQDGFSFKSPDFVKSQENATQVVRITDINNKNTNEDKVYIPNAFLEANNLKKYFVENGDLLLSLTGAAGFNFFFWDGGRAVINQRTSKVTPKKKLSSAMARLLEPLVHEKINVRGEGQNNNLSKEFLSSIILLIPEPDEQQRIADCLTSLDELIAAQAQKIDALKTHKKGLMQQLFPAEDETLPKLRFPEFRETGEWEDKRLGEVASFFKGKGISKAEIAINGRRPCIRYGELYTRYGEVIDEVFSRTDAADADLFFSRSNDVIIPGSGETKLDIAKASCVMHDDVALGGDLNVIRTEHNGVFLSYYFNGPKKWDIAKVAQGDTVVHLYPSQLEKLAIALPTPPEQQKIASCLSSLDDLITAQARKLDALKAHKKGLMQQLFPSP